jgi:hypothetical protein
MKKQFLHRNTFVQGNEFAATTVGMPNLPVDGKYVLLGRKKFVVLFKHKIRERESKKEEKKNI